MLRQLRCGGVLEAVRVFSAGYPDRLRIRDFLGTYACVVPPAALPPPPPPPPPAADEKASAAVKAYAEAMLRALGVRAEEARARAPSPHRCRTLLPLPRLVFSARR